MTDYSIRIHKLLISQPREAYDEPDDMGTCVQCNHWAPLGKGTLCQTCFMESQLPEDLDEDYEDYADDQG